MLLKRVSPSIEAGSSNPEISAWFGGIANLLGMFKKLLVYVGCPVLRLS